MDRVLKESYLLNPCPSRRKQSGKGWKNGHMVTAVTVTAIQTLQNRGFVYKYIYLIVVLMPCTSDGEALYDSKECLL